MTTEAAGARTLDGRATARDIRAEVADGVRALQEQTGVVPGLNVVIVGENPASQVYVRNKRKMAVRAGMASEVHELPAETSQEDLLALIERLNADERVHGILVQLPLSGHLDEAAVLLRIDPAKDVDGFHPESAGRLLSGLPGPVPCTPLGILELLKRNEIPLEGAEAVVLGRSNIVGKPVAVLLLREHATVTLCHSRTRDLPAVARRADILIAAIGRPGMVTEEYVKPGAVVVDVGINRVTDPVEAEDYFAGDEVRLAGFREKGSTLVGDVHPARVRPVAGWLTPVPGGVGPLTIALLLRNTLDAARRASGAAL
jgi:methylenetetrahydrofolate dehydrogenase (NADP+)/methenyltetrahydrofolate cyclohydrolase